MKQVKTVHKLPSLILLQAVSMKPVPPVPGSNQMTFDITGTRPDDSERVDLWSLLLVKSSNASFFFH